MFRYTPALASLTVLALFSGTAAASGLQVTPVTLTLQQNQRAEGLWLSNSGDSPVNAQVRVFHWSQSGYSDQLSSSQGLVISPPMLNIPPGGKQLIRVIRTGPPTKVEDAYRLSINELPPSTTTTTKKNSLQFVMHYSVPVFIQPPGATETLAKLQWQVAHSDGRVWLQVNNQGEGHAQLAEVTLITASGSRKNITPGLLGYVLPGSTMRWPLPASAGQGEKLEVTVNGQKTVQTL
ncbi:molecular chaperone [Kluyvera sichuanensis]|uniref:fimbrial biogenesis chaperone n=1 Tax=Kluyvera sichuanensis TaxID=2725494 RepID=UPI002FD6133B